jgi:hypothetical protein
VSQAARLSKVKRFLNAFLIYPNNDTDTHKTDNFNLWSKLSARNPPVHAGIPYRNFLFLNFIPAKAKAVPLHSTKALEVR